MLDRDSWILLCEEFFHELQGAGTSGTWNSFWLKHLVRFPAGFQSVVLARDTEHVSLSP